jgi:hypothetical protein
MANWAKNHRKARTIERIGAAIENVSLILSHLPDARAVDFLPEDDGE